MTQRSVASLFRRLCDPRADTEGLSNAWRQGTGNQGRLPRRVALSGKCSQPHQHFQLAT